MQNPNAFDRFSVKSLEDGQFELRAIFVGGREVRGTGQDLWAAIQDVIANARASEQAVLLQEGVALLRARR